MSDARSGSADVVARSEAAAFFDVDGTLVSTHIVHQYVFIRRELARRRGTWSQVGRLVKQVGFYARCLQYLYLDRVSRSRMNIAFYRNYAGLSVADVHSVVPDCFTRVLLPHLFVEGRACVAEHARAGRRVVLVTGSLDFIIAPLADYLASTPTSSRVSVVARSLVQRDGRFTGALDGPPIGEGEKSAAMVSFAEREGIDLARSHAYGDSIADLPMLESVGHPSPVNPDRRLAEVARHRGWPVQEWKSLNGSTC